MSADLVAWFRIQLDADEQVASAATPGPWRSSDTGPPHYADAAVYSDLEAVACYTAVYPETAISMDEDDAKHIALWDPRRALDEIAAKRAVLDKYELVARAVRQRAASRLAPDFRATSIDDIVKVTMYADVDYAGETALGLLHAVVLDLAQPYAGRHGWAEEWATDV